MFPKTYYSSELTLMKILYIITGLGLGGAEKIVTQLADEMYKKGHTVKIAYLTGMKLVQPSSKDIEIINLGLNSTKDFIKSSKNLKNLLIDYQPDIIHSHMIHANIFSRLNRIISPMKKLICTAHNSNEGGKIRMLAYKLTNPLGDIFTNVSKEATSAFVAKNVVKANQIMTVYNGIDINKFKNLTLDKKVYRSNINISEDIKLILAVGRFNDQKDYPNLINAIAILAKQRNDFRVIIVGDGPLRTTLQNLIDELNLNSTISLLGKRDDIPELMTVSDIYVLSSKYEGLPTVLIEAMACEKFIVATDCGGSREILGDTGILVPSKNSQALSDALTSALQLSAEEMIKNGVKARERVESTFSLESSVSHWLSLYEN